MLCSGKGAQTGFYVLPATLVVERPADGLTDEGAATPPTDAPVKLLYEVVVEAYVQSHGRTLAHKG